jgi:hypothetical protein
MRTLTVKLLLFIIALMFYSCSTSQSSYEWSSLSYMYESGPLPPKYQYNYTITLNTNFEGGMVAFVGADPSNPSLTYDFKISKDNLKSLDEAVKKSKILEDVIESIPEGSQPIGGHLEKIRVILYDDNPNLDRPPRVKESPYFPVEKYKNGLQKLYETVKAFVPKKVWDNFEAKKQEYQSKEQ